MAEAEEPKPSTEQHEPNQGWLCNPLAGLFEESQQRRLIDLLSYVAAASVAVAFPYTLSNLGAGGPVLWLLFAIGMAGFLGAPLLMRKTGSVEYGALTVLLTGIALIVIPASYGGGTEVVFAIWFLMIPLLAGLFLGPRMAISFGVMGVALISTFYLMERSSDGTTPPHGLATFMVWLNVTLATGFSAIVGALAARALMTSSSRLTVMSGELHESLDRHRASFEAAFDAMLTIGDDGRLLEFNPAAETIFGRTKEDVLGKRMAPLLIPERLREQHERAFRRYAETGEGRIAGQRVELEALRADGTEFTVELIVQPVMLSGRQHFTAYVRDLTDHYRALNRLREAEKRASQSQRLEALGRLAGGVAHDFNNLLTAINGYAELLAQGSGLDAEGQENVEQIRRAGQQASGVTRRLLAFGRKDRRAPAITDVNEAIRDLLTMFTRLLPESIEIHHDLATDLWQVDTRSESLEQVLLDMILNAGDAMPRGGELRLTTRNAVVGSNEGRDTQDSEALPAGEYVRILIADTGTGMDEETTRRIFEPFFTTKSAGQGTGLGLATAHGTIARCGGRIHVMSAPGKGTTFDLLLPRGTGAPKPPGRAQASAVEVSGKTILVVEDQAPLRRLLDRSLQQKGFRVLLAQDGLDAVERYGSGKEPVDLILTDVVMPRMGGVATVERLREKLGNPRVIFMSGYLGESLEGLPEFDDQTLFIEKPFRLDEIHAQVQTILRVQGESPD